MRFAVSSDTVPETSRSGVRWPVSRITSSARTGENRGIA